MNDLVLTTHIDYSSLYDELQITNTKKHKGILYVGNTIDKKDTEKVIQKLRHDFPELHCHHLRSIEGLFNDLPFMLNQVDFISIDYELLNDRDEACDVLKTLRTVIKYVYPNKSIMIGVVVGETTPDYLLKSLLIFKSVDYVICRTRNFITYKDLLNDLRRLYNGDLKISDTVKQLIDQTRKVDPKRKKDEFTLRQQQIIRLIRSRGLSNKHIAKTLDISESAVKAQLTQIYKKLGVRTRSQLLTNTKV